MPGADERMSSSAQRKSRKAWPPGLGALLAAAISAVALYDLAVDGSPRAQSPRAASAQADDAGSATPSPAHLFGFANAALAACNVKPGTALDALAAAVETNDEGVVPGELKAGFAEFQSLLQARGTAGACAMAERLLGPNAPMRANVLLPR